MCVFYLASADYVTYPTEDGAFAFSGAAGYVEIKKEFVEKIPRTLLRLTEEGRNAFVEYRQKMQQVLDSF